MISKSPAIKSRNDLWRLIGNGAKAAELGVAEGRFSETMLDWPCQLEILYLVDRWTSVPEQRGDASEPQSWHDANLAAAKERMARFGNRARFIVSDTVKAADSPYFIEDASLSLVYVDANHSYTGVIRDIRAWWPKLKPRGVMAFHDYEMKQYGVKRAVEEFAFQKRLQVFLIMEEQLEDRGAYFYVDPS
jgi:hypothetical protein